MPYVEREKGVRIHYNHYGKGFPLVFFTRLFGQRLALGVSGSDPGPINTTALSLKRADTGSPPSRSRGYSIQGHGSRRCRRPGRSRH